MSEIRKPFSMIVDYITGREIPNIGAEENRQAVEKLLVEEKGYLKSEIEVGVEMTLTVAGEPYTSQIDLVVSVDGTRMMVVKCVAGSLGSREREVLASARLLNEAHQIPVSVVSDGIDAIVLDTVTAKRIGEGVAAIPSKSRLLESAKSCERIPYPESRREREQLVFRTYDLENINILRNRDSS